MWLGMLFDKLCFPSLAPFPHIPSTVFAKVQQQHLSSLESSLIYELHMKDSKLSVNVCVHVFAYLCKCVCTCVLSHVLKIAPPCDHV